MSMIAQFNHVCKWIQIEILLCKTLRERAKFMRKALQIAKHCQDNQNYNSLCAIYSALNAAPIYRLNHAWDRIAKSKEKKYLKI
eukprot:UN32093